jgi:hypothetical protein
LFERLPTVLIGLWQVALVTRVWTGRLPSAGGEQPGQPGPGRQLSPAGLDPALRGEEGR